MAAGYVAVYYGAALRGASNAKANRELSWQPAYPTWRTGFEAMLSGGAGRGGDRDETD